MLAAAPWTWDRQRAPGPGGHSSSQELWARVAQAPHSCSSKSKPAPRGVLTSCSLSPHGGTVPYYFSQFFWANCSISAWSLCKEKTPKSSSRLIKAFLISEGKQAGAHPCSPPSVTDPIHPNHNSLPSFIAGSCCSYTNKCQWHLSAPSFNPWLGSLQLCLLMSVPSINHHEGSEAARLVFLCLFRLCFS